jgi:Tn3 transposase DDE domain-containing protein
MDLEAALQTFLPECSLLDIVWLTNASTRFTRHFGPISGLDSKLDRLDEKHCAAVFAMGSGMGVTQGARHMHGLVSAPTLALINRRHVTLEKLDAAHRDILDANNQFELPRCWGRARRPHSTAVCLSCPNRIYWQTFTSGTGSKAQSRFRW